MIKFYTSHCPACIGLKTMMNDKGIKYEEIDKEEIYYPIAMNNNIDFMPFADINGKIINSKELKEWIKKQPDIKNTNKTNTQED